MSTTEHQDDFAGLSNDETDELADVAEALRADRFESDDPAFWRALHARIMNEVEVTPIPQRDDEATRPDASAPGLFERLVQRLRPAWRRSLTSLALAAVAGAVLTLLVLSKDRPEELEPTLPVGPDLVDRAPGSAEPGLDGLDVATIPDELWHSGFLEHSNDKLVDIGAELGAEELGSEGDWAEGESADGDWLLDETGSWLALDWSSDGWSDGEGGLDPFAADYDWGLGALDPDELQALDELLDG